VDCRKTLKRTRSKEVESMTTKFNIDKDAVELQNITILSKEGQKELREQARKEGWGLLHELMLYNYVARSDGAFFKIDPDGRIHDIVSKPNLNKAIVEKMRKEIEDLSPATKFEVMMKLAELATKFPDIAKKFNDLLETYSDASKAYDAYLNALKAYKEARKAYDAELNKRSKS